MSRIDGLVNTGEMRLEILHSLKRLISLNQPVSLTKECNSSLKNIGIRRDFVILGQTELRQGECFPLRTGWLLSSTDDLHWHIWERIQIFKGCRSVTGRVRKCEILWSDNCFLSSPSFKKATSKCQPAWKMEAVLWKKRISMSNSVSVHAETRCQTTASSGHKPAKGAKKSNSIDFKAAEECGRKGNWTNSMFSMSKRSLIYDVLILRYYRLVWKWNKMLNVKTNLICVWSLGGDLRKWFTLKESVCIYTHYLGRSNNGLWFCYMLYQDPLHLLFRTAGAIWSVLQRRTSLSVMKERFYLSPHKNLAFSI